MHLDFDDLGDQCKRFEQAPNGPLLMPGLPVLCRLDGKKFHKFTRGLARPFDARLSRMMIETTKYLVERTGAAIGYTQSDEITLAWPNTDVRADLLFEGRRQKWESVFAAEGSVRFNKLLPVHIPEKADQEPVFDCRVWNVPTLHWAALSILWRELDATKNSISMAASAYFSPRVLEGVPSSVRREMLREKGVNWEDYPTFFKRGTYVRKETVVRALTEAEAARIPEKYRPKGPIQRRVMVEMDMPPATRLANLEGALLLGEVPALLSDATEAVAAAPA